MIETGAVGKKYPAVLYEVTERGITEYARTLGIDTPCHFEHKAACEAGFRDIVAPPMYAGVYSAPAVFAVMNDPEVGMDVPRNLHASQWFVWSEPVCAEDIIFTEATVAEIVERNRKGFYVFETVSTNQHGQETARGVWTNIVRLGIP
jgi:acyl dehydratase